MPMGIGLGIAVTRGGNVGWWQSGSALDLDFANSRGFNSIDRTKTTPDSILTYTAPSPKMVYGSDGVLRYAPHNLFVRSGDFSNASWTTGAIASGTRVNGSVSVSADNGYAYVRQDFTALNKAVIASYEVTCDTTVANVPIVFSNGSVNYPVVTSFVAGVPQRITSPTFTAGSFASVGIDLRDFIAPGGSNTTGYTITFNKAQLQLYPNHDSTYVPTTTAAVYSLPIDYNPTTFASLGVLIEEQRTNLLTYSEQFDNAAWTKGGFVTVTANAVTAPDGTTTADKVVETAATSTHYISQTATIVAATVYTYSVYAKAAERSWVCLEGGSGAGGYQVWFNLSTGTVGTINNTAAGNVSIVALPNGWYRCIVTDTSTSTSGTYRYFICDADNNQSYTGDGTSGLYLWGAQLEEGAFATSYIPTVASQVTRAADQVSILTSAFAYNTAELTMLENVVFDGVNASGYRYCAGVWNGSVAEAITFTSNAGLAAVRIRTGGADQMNNFRASPAMQGTTLKRALAAKANDCAVSYGGAAVVADATVAMPSGITTLFFAAYGSTHMKRFTLWNTRKSDAELQALSA